MVLGDLGRQKFSASFSFFNIFFPFNRTSSPLPLPSVCGSAELPAAAGHAVVRRLPGLEEATLGCQTGYLLHHRPALSCLLTGTDDRMKGVYVKVKNEK